MLVHQGVVVDGSIILVRPQDHMTVLELLVDLATKLPIHLDGLQHVGIHPASEFCTNRLRGLYKPVLHTAVGLPGGLILWGAYTEVGGLQLVLQAPDRVGRMSPVYNRGETVVPLGTRFRAQNVIIT